MYEAVHTARDRMDYNQGGWFIKALDQCGFNFLNASVVGTRTFWRNAIDNPVDFTAKTIQIGVVSAGIAATGWLLYPNVMKEIPDEGNENNITWPLFPNWLVVKDKNGDDRHFYAKLRVDPGAAFMNKFFNGVTETYLYDKGLIKEEPNYKKLVKQLKALGPIGMSLPPSLQLWHDYSTNYSWWKDRQIYTEAGGRTFNWPDSKNEGVYDYKKGLRDPSISQLSTDIGQISGLSPKRLQETIGNVIPRGNEFVYLFGKSYEEAFSDLSNEVKNQHWLLSLAEIPGINKIIGVTRPGYNRNEEITKESDKELLESVIRNGKLDFLASSYYWYKAGKYEDMIDYVENFKDIDVKHNLIDRMKFIEKTKDLTHRNLWLRLYHMSPEAKAKDFRSALTKADEKEKTELWNDYSKLSSIGGYITQDFRDEYKKLVK